ncbi:hypothetical protein PT974_03488 [Cladobotryum mycophilum]|uniref:Uncharacterized protein n=1 Tax=Cladobotryum mycophilum TaxID=491253 RepID=A0ABR0SSF4_9HYPO
MKVTSLVEFGIRWNPKYKVSDTAISLQLHTHATLYGNTGEGTSVTLNVCYGAVTGAELFAQLKAPNIFGVNLNRRWSFYKRAFPIVEEQCYDLKQFAPSSCSDY